MKVPIAIPSAPCRCWGEGTAGGGNVDQVSTLDALCGIRC